MFFSFSTVIFNKALTALCKEVSYIKYTFPGRKKAEENEYQCNKSLLEHYEREKLK